MFPIIPPKVARFWVEGSGPKRRPNGAAAFCSSDMTTPGCTRATRASGSMPKMAFMCREKSRTIPSPMELPAHDVPPPRPVIGTPNSRAAASAAATSSASLGKATTRGGIL